MTDFFHHAPIKRKLMAMLMFISGAVMLLTCAAFCAYELVTFRRAIVRQLSTLGEIVAANSTAALAFDNADDAREILTALRAEPHIVAAALYDRTGRLYASYPAGMPVESLPEAAGKIGHLFTTSTLAGFQPVVHSDGRRLGTLYLRSNLDAIYERFQLYGGIVVLVLAVCFAVAYGLSKVLQRHISHPILALAETARAISTRHDYSVRAEKQGNDELGLLTDAFNQMLTQIHAQDEALRESENRIKKLNQELEQRVVQRTAQLAEANQELEAFSYSVSHDLRAPLRHIDGFAGLLGKHVNGTLDDLGRRYLTTISDSAKRMGRLIDDLLVFSRMSRVHLSVSTVDHGNLVAGVIREGQFDPRIRWQIATLPATPGDPSLLRQVWANLIENAVKYSGKAPEPRIEIGAQHDDAGAEALFFVRDNGVGFDMAYGDKLFGVFQRLHDATEFEGTGIGLANVRRIVTRHSGRVWAEARVGHGATFYFSLPLASLSSTPPV